MTNIAFYYVGKAFLSRFVYFLYKNPIKSAFAVFLKSISSKCR